MIEVARSVGLTEDQAPLLMSMFMLACFVLSLPAGFIAEKVKVKHALALSALFSFSGSALGSFAHSPTGLLFSRGLEGAGFVLMCICIPVAVSTYTKPKDVGLVMGICSMWVSIGSIVALNTIPLLSYTYSWEGIWRIYAALTALGAALFWLLFGRDNAQKSITDSPAAGTTVDDTAVDGSAGYLKADCKPDAVQAVTPGAKPALFDAFRNKNLVLPSIGFMVFNINTMAMFTFFTVFVTSSGLMTIEKASFTASLPMILSLVSLPLFGRLADRFGHKYLYMFTLLCAGVGVGLMYVKSAPVILLGAVILGMAGTSTPGLVFSSVGKLIPSEDLIAQSNGIIILFQNAGLFLSSFLFGSVVKAVGDSYTTAGLLLILLTAIAVALVSRAQYNE